MTRSSALKRIKKELAEIKKSPPVEVSVGPSGDNLFHWEGILNGPEDSPYAGGVFKFVIDFPDDYPMKAPSVKFTSRMYHPNISPDSGHICVDILQGNWSGVYTVSNIMISISSLLNDPNPDSPLNRESARLYKTDRQEYNKTVKRWVKKFANPENL